MTPEAKRIFDLANTCINIQAGEEINKNKEGKYCPDCKKLVQTNIVWIDPSNPLDGECIICEQCGYCFEYLEDEMIRRWKRYRDELEIIKALQDLYSRI